MATVTSDNDTTPKRGRPPKPRAEAIEAEAPAPSPGRRFECPASRNGMVLLWAPTKPGYQKRVRFLGGFHATADPDELECLDYLASTGQVFEVPYETSRPTRPADDRAQLPASYGRPAPED